ncbi:low-affinity glucose transporter HXT3 [Xylariaceae sp. FL0255]|nr:low-affinity glucose transporter HXT3 [Xylariaceae sp. FL0255]
MTIAADKDLDVLSEKEGCDQHVEDSPKHQVFVNQEPSISRLIPGYSKSRCIELSGMPMMLAVTVLARLGTLFFDYDATAMSQVNTNENHLKLVGVDDVGSYADKIERLKTIFLGCIWAIVGAALQAGMPNLVVILIGRIVGGVGCGHLNTVIPIGQISKIADLRLRGAFVAVQFTLCLLGSLVVFWKKYGVTTYQSPEFAWRFPLGFHFLLGIIVLAAFFPESPLHLAKLGCFDEAQDILERCRSSADHAAIIEEVADIKVTLFIEAKASQTKYWSMLTRKDEFNTRRHILLGGRVQMLQKLIGIDFISTYPAEIFAVAGYSSDHVGRRKLMLSGSSLMAIVLIIGDVLSRQTNLCPEKASQTGAGVAGCSLPVYLHIRWVYPTECFPLDTRAKGTAPAAAAFSITGGVISTIIPYLISASAVGWWIFFIFAIVNYLILIPVYLLYVETANRHFEDLDYLFVSKSPFAWRAEKEFAHRKASPQLRLVEEEKLNVV